MRLGVRGKLFLISLTLILAVLLVGGVFLEGQLRAELEARIETELLRHARAARVLIREAPRVDSIAAVDPLADALARASGARVTIIAADGVVLGESERDPAGVARMENHGNRPEIQAALVTGQGVKRRYSTTLEKELLYVAVPYTRPDGRGVTRVATPLRAVDLAIGRYRQLLWLGGLLALAAAVLMSAFTSHYFSRTLRLLVRHAHALAEGKERRRIEIATSDRELAGLAGSLNRMAEELDAVVRDLRLERDRSQAVLEAMEEAVLAVDATDRITLANRAALDLLGLTATPEGERLAAILPQPELARLVARTRQGEPDRDEFDLPGERPRRVLALTSMMRESGRTVIVLRDMTEIRHLERVRQDFVANVSHELRTPVSVLRATAETLLGGALDDPARSREFLGAIERNSERLSRLISDLLDISRIEAGTVHIERRELSLHEVARRTVAALERPAREKRMRVELAVGDDVRVRADSKALDQVIFNLLENAIKYTPADGTVTVGARAIDGRVRLEVADNGPGIAAEHRERVFERFYRIDPGRSRDMGGTGLGLAIVKHLVALMQGEVGVEPRAPQGTRFWVSLPSA